MYSIKKLGVNGLFEWLLPLYVLLLPWQARFIIAPFSFATPRYGDLSVYVTDSLFLVLVVLWFLYLRREHHQAHPEWRRLRPVILSVLALFSYAILSLLWTPHALIGQELLVRCMQAILLAMMIAGGPVSMTRLLLAISISGAVQGGFALQQFFSQSINASTILGMAAQAPQNLGVSVIEYADERWLRAYGTLPHPNMLGAFCGLAMLSSAFLIWRGYRVEHARLVAFGWISFVGASMGWLLAFSRSAWLATVIAGLVFLIGEMFVLQNEARKTLLFISIKLVGALLLFLLFFSAMFGPLWWSRGTGEGRLAQQSSTERSTLAEQAQNLAEQRPWFGHGIGSYMPALMKTYPGQPLYSYQPVHRLLSLVRVEYGWIGLVFVVGVIGSLMYVLMRLRFVFGLALLGFFLVASFFDHFWYSLPFGLALMAALCSLSFAQDEALVQRSTHDAQA